VDFTLLNGSTAKGLLVPFSVLDPRPSENGKVKQAVKRLIPFNQCVPIIRRLGANEYVGSDTLKIYGEAYGNKAHRVEVPASKAKGGEIYLNRNILALVDGKSFTGTGSVMVSSVNSDHLEAFCNIISKEIGLLCEVSDDQEAMLPKQSKKSERKVIRQFEPFPPMPINTDKNDNAEEDAAKQKRLRLMRMKAKALQLRLKLLSV
jgi:hypothetical protein